MKASLKAVLLAAVLLVCALFVIHAKVANPSQPSPARTAPAVSSTAPPPVPRPAMPSAAPLRGGGKGDIEVTTSDGAKHVVRNCVEDRHLQGSGTPWDDSVAMDRDYPKLKTLIAVNLHPLAVSGGGYTSQDPPLRSAVLLIPMSAITDIKFTTGRAKMTEASVYLASGESFTTGSGFGHLAGKESLGSLGSAHFDSWVGDIKELRAFSPVPFTADFSFFGVHKTPFRANVIDTTGTRIVLKKALFLDMGTVERSRYPYMGTTGYDSLVFSSSLSATRGKATKLDVPSSKISRIKLRKAGNDGYDAQVTLRTGETFDLTIISSKGMNLPSSGILGFSSKGWVWVPWSVVSTIEIDGQ